MGSNARLWRLWWCLMLWRLWLRHLMMAALLGGCGRLSRRGDLALHLKDDLDLLLGDEPSRQEDLAQVPVGLHLCLVVERLLKKRSGDVSLVQGDLAEEKVLAVTRGH